MKLLPLLILAVIIGMVVLPFPAGAAENTTLQPTQATVPGDVNNPPSIVPFPVVFYSAPPVQAPGVFPATRRGIAPMTLAPAGVRDRNNLTTAQKKMSSTLLRVSSPALTPPPPDNAAPPVSLTVKKGPAGSGLQTATSGIPLSGDLVYVYVYLEPGFPTHIVDPVVNVTDRDEENHLVVGWVDLARLRQLADLTGVKSIQEVLPPLVNTGSVTTQGDVVHKTANVRSTYGYKGTGMKIGIISDGVNHISTSIASGDLPANVHVLSDSVGGDEGTAMLEIVHDMVPDAELYFHDCGTNKVAFNAAIDDLKANGCTIICDDISWLTEPFFEDGIIATHVSTLLSENTLVYLSSAGNSGQRHYQGVFVPDQFGFHNAPLYAHMPTGSSVTIVLEWNDQFGHSGNDYDLYLYDTANYNSPLASGTNPQTGTQDPIEAFSYTNAGAAKDVEIDAYRYNGTAKTLEIYVYPSSGATMYSNNLVAADSIFGHPAVPGAIAAAAVPWSSPATIESFSSQGPVTISYPSATIRQKPDISGVDGVSVTGSGGFPSTFYGTSASAPHIAAVVAQIWGAHPALTPAQVKTKLFTTSVNLGAPGFDTVFGNGRADALAMANTGPIRPVVNFVAGVTSGESPLEVSFTDTSANTPVGWAWFFGDEPFTQPWTRVNASAGWTARSGQETVLLPDGSLVLTGGNDAGAYLNDTWRSTDNGATWMLMNPGSGWTGRTAHAGVAMPDGSIVLMGGANDRLWNDTWRSADKGATWTRMNTSSGWTSRYYHASAAMPDGSILLTGGREESGRLVNDTWRSADNGATWALMNASSGWAGRDGHSVVVIPDGSIILMGGYDGTLTYNDTWRSTNNGATWSQVNASSGWPGRQGQSVVAMPDGSIVLTGGYAAPPLYNDVWRSKDKGSTWSQVNASAGWAQRLHHSSIAMPDGSIVLLGGMDDLSNVFGDVWRIQPAASSLRNPSHVYAKPGNYSVTLQAFNAAGFSSLEKPNYIWAKRPVPTFTSIAPSGPWIRNSTVNFSITGTKFQPGNTLCTFHNKSGILLNGTFGAVLTSVTTTRINGTIHVPHNASVVTPYDVNITTVDGGSYIQRAVVMAGSQPAPTIGTITPVSGNKNSTVNFSISGTNFQSGTDKTRVRLFIGDPGEPVDTELSAVILQLTPTRIAGSVDIAAAAMSGPYTVEVYTVDGGTAARGGAFTVGYAALPSITSVSPTSGFRNDTIPFTIRGTGFQPGKTTVVFRNQTDGSALGAMDLSGVTATQIMGNLSIPNTAPAAYYRLDISTADGGVTSRLNALRVTAVSAPAVASITPASGSKNSSVAFTITGTNFQTNEKTSVKIREVVTGTDLPISLLSVTSARVIGTVTIPDSAPAGKYNLEVRTTDGGTVTRYDAFTVNPQQLPVIVSITPASGFRNATVPFVIRGSNYVNGSTTVRIRTSGATFYGNLAFVNQTTITGSFSIANTAPTGPYRLDVITLGGGIGSRTNAFAVTSSLRPVITSVSPASGFRNTSVAFTLGGSNFVSGETTVKFLNQSANASTDPPAIRVMDPAIISVTPTQIIGSLVIPYNASVNLWKINVTTVNGGEVSKAGAFTVK